MWWLKAFKWACIIWIGGIGVGAYGGYNYAQDRAAQVENIAARGYCAKRDPLNTLFWFRCVDSLVAAQLHVDDAESDAILADMQVKQAKRKK